MKRNAPRSKWFADSRAALAALGISETELDGSMNHVNLKTGDNAPNRDLMRAVLDAAIVIGRDGLREYGNVAGAIPHDLMGDRVPSRYAEKYPAGKAVSVTRLVLMASGRPFDRGDALGKCGLAEEAKQTAAQVCTDLLALAHLGHVKGAAYNSALLGKVSKQARAILQAHAKAEKLAAAAADVEPLEAAPETVPAPEAPEADKVANS